MFHVVIWLSRWSWEMGRPMVFRCAECRCREVAGFCRCGFGLCFSWSACEPSLRKALQLCFLGQGGCKRLPSRSWIAPAASVSSWRASLIRDLVLRRFPQPLLVLVWTQRSKGFIALVRVPRGRERLGPQGEIVSLAVKVSLSPCG